MRVSGTEDELVEFAFTSVASPGLPPAALVRLAHQAWSFNTRMGLTGSLDRQGDRLSQVVEGPCRMVQALAARILADPRHREIAVVAFGRLACRRHGAWTSRGFDFVPPEVAALRACAAVVPFVPLPPAALALALAAAPSRGAGTV